MKKKLVVLSGAGISAESGISTFRDSGGLWEQYRVKDVASPEGFGKNPELVLKFYNERRKQLQTVIPNKGHKLLAELEKDFEVTVITQNVDNLHERAGSTNVLHLHGELTKVTSSASPNDSRYIKEIGADEEIHLGDLAADHSQLRPFIVWFGEAVPMIEKAARITQQADVFVIVGTSMNVYPAAGLLDEVPDKASVYLIDPNEVSIHARRPIEVIRKGGSEGVAELLSRLGD